MKNKFLNIAGVEVLSKNQQKEIIGQAGGGNVDLSKCGCDCAGAVTGPVYCHMYIACPQVYTCKDVI